jgi:hypothetical protein
MFEGRGGTGGWLVVVVAVVALLGFTGLLYVRGASGPAIALSIPTHPPGPSPTPRPLPSGSGLPGSSPGASPAQATAGPTPSPTPTASSSPEASPSSPEPTESPSVATPTPAASGAAGSLPKSPQPATVALTNGQGGCPNLPTGGVTFETKFTLAASGRLTVTSQSGHKLTGRLLSSGSFDVSGSSPVERWLGSLSDTGGTGSYFVVSAGCTEGYETTIAFHP